MSTTADNVDYNGQLTENIIPSLVSDGKFGKDVVVSRIDAKPVGGLKEDHWMSKTFAVSIDLGNTVTGATSKKELIVKFQTRSGFYSVHADHLASNEEIMYNQVVPFFEELWKDSSASLKDEGLQLFPKCFLAQTGEQPVVVMEDLHSDGYRLAESRTALDKAHVFLALRKLGRMHALSYAAKVRRKEDFLSLTRLLREPNYTEELRQQDSFFSGCAVRRLQRLAARGEAVIDPATVDFLRARLGNSYDILMEGVRTEEPLAVITHGDFCRNNMCFRYDASTGQPVDVRFFDLQTPRYCTPAVDLSFFLLMNTSAPLRAQHWDDMFLEYYDALSTTLRHLLSSGQDTPTTTDIPSLAALKADFARHALYGFVICSFFLPEMEYPAEGKRANEMIDKGGDPAEMFCEIGGDAAADCMADMLLELVDRNLINKPS